MFIRATVLTICALLTTFPAHAQERFSLFVPSNPESVERMLTIARLQDNDVVVDLGSGNGLIPLTAAKMNPRLRGLGVDINARLVEESNTRAKTEGVADRVRFEHRNAFDADLREATVITMWLFPELMSLLRPIILERARPGTRVVTSTWSLGSWQPDEVLSDDQSIFLWIVPARVAGGWDWDLNVAGRRIRYGSHIDQQYQKLDGAARAGDRREVLTDMSLRGDEIKFSLNITLDGLGLTQHQFTGKVNGNQIVGTVTLRPSDQVAVTVPWRARKSERSRYFAPTGTAMFEQPPD
jgi:precorrin-6B methylase 2